MDRRYDMRVPTYLPVSIVQLEDGTKIVGTLVDISESGICASLPESMDPGTLVQVHVLEVGLFGEIVYSNPEVDGFRTGIFVEQVLLETSNVAKIVQSYLESSNDTAGLRLVADEPRM
jgi:hypothetical protein